MTLRFGPVPEPVESTYTQRLRRGEKPQSGDIRDHLQAVHRSHAGFAEACALKCRDQNGRNSYRWLLECVSGASAVHRNPKSVLDLGCGAGALLEEAKTLLAPETTLIGVDMSADELAIARDRLPNHVVLHEGLAQDMAFIEDASVDVVLCHWALTLIAPVEPALREVHRILRPGGTFAAIIDGDFALSRSYTDVHHLIYGWVERTFPDYALHEMGDPRVRSAAPLRTLIEEYFPSSVPKVDGQVFYLEADADTLAREAADFFYACYVLRAEDRLSMLEELAQYFSTKTQPVRFEMPINRLVVRKAIDA